LSGLGPGFGNPFSGYIWAMCEHEGWLYVATAVWAVFLRYAGRKRKWPNELRSFFSPENIERILLRFGGCDLWRTRDGYHWIPVTQNGFDNCFNIGFRNMVSSPYGLFVGAANPFAPEVAVRRIAGWRYESNLRGGLEIWLGSPARTALTCSPDSSENPIQVLPESHSTGDGTEGNGSASSEKIINEFFTGSGFRNFGFWRVDIQDAGKACENLMDELLAFLPPEKGTVVDLGCGYGATTKYLLKYFSPQAVTGITTNRKFLHVCRENASQVNFLHMNLSKLQLQSESFDVVVWVKGFDRLDPRQNLLQESFRILKPGGQLVCFDVLYAVSGKKSLWKKFRAHEDAVKTMDEYRDLLCSAGFQKIQIADITAWSLDSFREHKGKYFELKQLSGEIDDSMLQEIETYFSNAEKQVNQCVLISACK
jgi:ubiquinone/menaquinone biosynthesis C-methylase UbiE